MLIVNSLEENTKTVEEIEEEAKQAQKLKDKEKPNFELSGKLSEESRITTNGVILKFVEPSDAKIPKKGWVIYPFKDDKPLDPIKLDKKQSCYLFGRDRTVADISIDHPSCSKQHTVLQFRSITTENKYTGDKRTETK